MWPFASKAQVLNSAAETATARGPRTVIVTLARRFRPAPVADSVSLYFTGFAPSLSGIGNSYVTLPPLHENVAGRPARLLLAESVQDVAPLTAADTETVPFEKGAEGVATSPEITGLAADAVGMHDRSTAAATSTADASLPIKTAVLFKASPPLSL